MVCDFARELRIDFLLYFHQSYSSSRLPVVITPGTAYELGGAIWFEIQNWERTYSEMVRGPFFNSAIAK